MIGPPDRADQVLFNRPDLQSADSGSSSGSTIASTSTTVQLGNSNAPTPPTPPEIILSASAQAPIKLKPSRTSTTGGFSPPGKKKVAGRRSRPATAPTVDSSRAPLLPARPAFVTKSDDERQIIGYSVSRGRSLGVPAVVPSAAISEVSRRHSRGTGTRAGHLASSVELQREFQETIIDGVTTDVSPLVAALGAVTLTPSVSASNPMSSGLAPGIDWPSATDTDTEIRDWPTFIRAYAAGQWDPYKIPIPPRSTRSSHDGTDSFRLGSPSSGASSASLRRSATAHVHGSTPPDIPPNPSMSNELALGLPGITMSSVAPSPQSALVSVASQGFPPPSTLARHSSNTSSTPSGPPTPSIAQRRGAGAPDLRTPTFNVVHPTPPNHEPSRQRPILRSSGSDPIAHAVLPEDLPTSPAPSAGQITAAATVRWAGAGVDLAPLTLPSPEHELTDPMRRLSLEAATRPSPGQLGDRGGRASKLERSVRSAWDGLPSSAPVTRQKPYGDLGGYFEARSAKTPLEAITGSPTGSPGERVTPGSEAPISGPSNADSASSSSSPVAIRGMSQKLAHQDRHQSASSPLASPGSTGSYYSFHDAYTSLPSAPAKSLGRTDYFGDFVSQKSTGRTGSPVQTRTPDIRRASLDGGMLPVITSEPSSETSSAMTMPLTACDPRTTTIASVGVPGSIPESHEAFFARMGYLPAPIPPQEGERRKALYRYNILYTAKDVNFDRIVHLAKLVFNTKMVLITMIDQKQLWAKSETGAGVSHVDRSITFCGHTILQKTEEPLVVLDATKDWRFANNPMVTSGLKVRFYAGAPLRTPDGYNLGTLCVCDDEPRAECSPRTRHTLKEFAAIVMREMELWRDKIQLRIRDRIQTSMEHFTRECLQMDAPGEDIRKQTENSMQKVYQDAATLVKRTLDVDGALVLDVSHFETIETLDADGKRTVFYHGDLYDASSDHSPKSGSAGERRSEFSTIPALPILGADEAESNPMRDQQISGEDHAKISKFLSTCPEGKIYERLPGCFRKMVPQNLQYAMIVPVFNVDKRPFLLLCAYTTKGTMHYLEGYELQYLRAVGVIILSAILKRRMILADTAKSLFISNISHELRTPLHGILASAELLHDTRLTNTQDSYLKTVQACAQSLVETVNHVLDFTKLSGNSRESSKQHPIKLTKIDLKHLIDETVEGCWLGSRARAGTMAEDIGSVYSPPSNRPQSPDIPTLPRPKVLVETVTDIALRPEGWWVFSDRGGIRRILMNLIGNSIKFTRDGFIQVRLREIPQDTTSNRITIEITVSDSGKGISKDFLQNRIFQPFSQENPLQTGTGLGLAIVNSIGTSLGGKLDVWSAERVGTEMRLIMQVEPANTDPTLPIAIPPQSTSVSMLGFDLSHKGVRLLHETMVTYIADWWGFRIIPEEEDQAGDILFINDDAEILHDLTANGEFVRPVILLSSRRGDSDVMAAVGAFERMGGWCRLIFKPSGPVRLEDALRAAIARLDTLRHSPPTSADPVSASSSFKTAPESASPGGDSDVDGPQHQHSPSSRGNWRRLHMTQLSSLTRRRSEEHHDYKVQRPPLGTRSSTHTGTSLRNEIGRPLPEIPTERRDPGDTSHPDSPVSSIVSIADDGSVMLRSAVGATDAERKPNVLLVDDNVVNRNLLAHWLKKRGFDFSQACDGQEAVDIFRDNPPGFFDVLLLDLSMPRMDGFQAAQNIRQIETDRQKTAIISDTMSSASVQPSKVRSKIFALTGLASIEDKRKAFTAGVDGYLIKPVSLKTLDGVFERLKRS